MFILTPGILLIFFKFSESLPAHVKKGFTLLLVGIFEPEADVLQKNNLLFKPPSAYKRL
jgi:hypothetical protein